MQTYCHHSGATQPWLRFVTRIQHEHVTKEEGQQWNIGQEYHGSVSTQPCPLEAKSSSIEPILYALRCPSRHLSIGFALVLNCSVEVHTDLLYSLSFIERIGNGALPLTCDFLSVYMVYTTAIACLLFLGCVWCSTCQNGTRRRGPCLCLWMWSAGEHCLIPRPVL